MARTKIVKEELVNDDNTTTRKQKTKSQKLATQTSPTTSTKVTKRSSAKSSTSSTKSSTKSTKLIKPTNLDVFFLEDGVETKDERIDRLIKQRRLYVVERLLLAFKANVDPFKDPFEMLYCNMFDASDADFVINNKIDMSRLDDINVRQLSKRSDLIDYRNFLKKEMEATC